MPGKILIIDDEEKLRKLLRRILELEGYTLLEASSGKSALQVLGQQEDIEVVITDVKLPDCSGIELTTRIKAIRPLVEVIVLTAYGSIPGGVEAIKNGAFDYITKGDDNDRLLPLVSKAMEKAGLYRKAYLTRKKVSVDQGFEAILGKSRAIREAVRLAEKVAPTDTTVLLQGETGTGKEVFALSIHSASPRRNRSFVAINCAALSRDILESELFGHLAGAFTGAQKDKKGLFEEADGGTLFLDEIGEMSPGLQAKLLRVLETGSFLKVGGTTPVRVDVRVIAATNKDLLRESEQGVFRPDLYYRLSAFEISLPPLRERGTDILDLASCFIQQYAARLNRPTPTWSESFLALLMSHPWKGNIRELKNIMERVVILSEGDTLTPNLLPREFLDRDPVEASPFDLSEVEKRHIAKILVHTGGNKAEAARLMNIGLTTLYRKIAEYRLDSPTAA
ncbi:MAG TPA: sigma-54 dependent transcriptional regulator [Chitinophagaceae bacterium]|nr:sigma-54 dependent transcriptional regulator [Chitinophagaceae bacterium]